MGKPSTSDDIKKLEQAQQAAAAAQAMMDQNAKFGPKQSDATGAGIGAGSLPADETTIGLLRRKYGIGGGNPLSGFFGGA